jgi:hypothetical protein
MSYLGALNQELEKLDESWFDREHRDGTEKQEGND